MTETKDRALLAARRGRAALAEMQTRDAAWYGLLSVELDDTCSLGWALLAHILTEATRDPVATWSMHNALIVGLPPEERPTLTRYHRVDLWARGLLCHQSGQAIIGGDELDDDDAFRPSPRLEPWLEETAASWGGPKGVLTALQRMVAALSDAWEIPHTQDALRDDVEWSKKPDFEQWVANAPVDEAPAPSAVEPAGLTADLRVLSDYWMKEEIAQLATQGAFELARSRAEEWQRMRPERLEPMLALLRVHAATDAAPERDALAQKIAEHEVASLEDREEARLLLGELGLWRPQLQLLDRMLEEAPEHPLILTNRGVAKLQIGDEKGAAEDLQRVIEIQPDTAPALANLGLLRMRREEYGEARRLLEAATEAAPDEPDVRVYLAVCKSNQGERQGAIVQLRRALELEPEHAEAARLMTELGA